MKNPPIAYSPETHQVMLRNGRTIPFERWARQDKLQRFRAPASRKEARAQDKTIRLSDRRARKHGGRR